MLTVVVSAGAFRITKGEPASAPLGKTRTNYYCGSCASHMFSENSDHSGLKHVTGGLFDDTSWITPCAHIWTSSAQPWVIIPSDVPTYQTQPEDMSELLGLWRI